MFRSLLQAYYLRQSKKRPLSPLEYATVSAPISTNIHSGFFFSSHLSKYTFFKKNKNKERSKPIEDINNPLHGLESEKSRAMNSARFGKYDTSAFHHLAKYALTSLTLGVALIWFIIESYQGLTLF